ncbi:uncharacterized protein LOC126551802 [Aphis gossypii]|uniref:Uncharacterized protein n=1 Tax=Aphis gossypii TaxID=80765 RepID=A0A9P0JAX5_APHGO|nr:uncharacterized protein LOC126551802 [Aphis gossypii]CAH1733232.1 unnamed protein product [Aphis gossypii]
MTKQPQGEDKKVTEMGFTPTPRPGGFLKIKLDVKEKKNKVLQFDQYQNIISRVEDMEKNKFRTEKTVVKNPTPPTITPIRNLNLPKISQESLFDKCLIENEDNGETQNEYEKWLDETAPANDTNLMDNLEEAINFIVLLASKPEADSSDFDEMQAISVVQFLRTIKTPNGVYEPNNLRLMEYIDKKGEEFHKQ